MTLSTADHTDCVFWSEGLRKGKVSVSFTFMVGGGMGVIISVESDGTGNF